MYLLKSAHVNKQLYCLLFGLLFLLSSYVIKKIHGRGLFSVNVNPLFTPWCFLSYY